ncbi:serine/threonine protein kinase, partial [Myxococcota bacterium]|nr:serine/threonine protein kinase [Myxococcota bacterium]
MDWSEGLLFERYEFLQRLGEGGQAEVWEVKLRGVGGFTKHIALKVLRNNTEQRHEAQQRLISEARIVSEMHHPHIVEIYDVGGTEHSVYIAMELVRGIDLDSLLQIHLQKRQKPLPWPLASQLIADTCKGLHHAHQFASKEHKPFSLVHRDLKLKNLILDQNGFIKIIDFGIARVRDISPTTHSAKLRGTPAFMSPEQIRNESIDHRSDLFSLGVIFYALLCGCLPFDNKDIFSTLYQIVSKQPDPPRQKNPNIPPEIEHIILSLLAKDPALRFDSACAVQHAIQIILHKHQIRVDYEDIAQFTRNLQNQPATLTQDNPTLPEQLG